MNLPRCCFCDRPILVELSGFKEQLLSHHITENIARLSSDRAQGSAHSGWWKEWTISTDWNEVFRADERDTVPTKLEVDSRLGTLTQEQLQEFQKGAGLEVDGIFGDQSRELLLERLSSRN